MSFVLFPEAFAAIGHAGLLGGAKWAFAEMEMLAAFWFLAFTWPALALGIAVTASFRDLGKVPGARTVGIVLIITVIGSGLILPLSGLWAFLIPGFILTIGDRRSADG